jgi:hypothetical protein
MLRILGKRWPLAKVLLLPVRVQGVEAPPEIAGAIRYANEFDVADLIITGRGGGSIEDLWAFNDERVARAIYASEIPVISAVGHEPDVTISDFVADLRAATPSNAAELVAPDQMELKTALLHAQSAMNSAMDRRVKLARLEQAGGQLVLVPGQIFPDFQRRLIASEDQGASSRHAPCFEIHMVEVRVFLSPVLDGKVDLRQHAAVLDPVQGQDEAAVFRAQPRFPCAHEGRGDLEARLLVGFHAADAQDRVVPLSVFLFSGDQSVDLILAGGDRLFGDHGIVPFPAEVLDRDIPVIAFSFLLFFR